MQHVISKAGKPFLHDFAASKLVREPDLATQVPVLITACKAVQYASYERITRADRTNKNQQRNVEVEDSQCILNDMSFLGHKCGTICVGEAGQF